MKYLAPFALGLLVGCGSPSHNSRFPTKPEQAPSPAEVRSDHENSPPRLTVCHVDVGFSEDEAVHIRNAASAWALLSKGHARIVTRQDLDFSDASIERARGACTVVRVDSKDNPEIVAAIDSTRRNVRIIGLTVLRSNGERHVYLVMDRIRPDQFVWVAMHEFGHVLGLDDLEQQGHVMSRVGPFEGQWLTAADEAECKAARVCP